MAGVHADTSTDGVQHAEADNWVAAPAGSYQAYGGRRLVLKVRMDHVGPVRLDVGPIGY